MSELRINGFAQVRDILTALKPFIRFKKIQARAMLKAVNLLSAKSSVHLTRVELLEIVECILAIQRSNYASKAKKTQDRLIKMFDLTP